MTKLNPKIEKELSGLILRGFNVRPPETVGFYWNDLKSFLAKEMEKQKKEIR